MRAEHRMGRAEDLGCRCENKASQDKLRWLLAIKGNRQANSLREKESLRKDFLGQAVLERSVCQWEKASSQGGSGSMGKRLTDGSGSTWFGERIGSRERLVSSNLKSKRRPSFGRGRLN